MCWIGNQNSYKIAKDDIVVYKVVFKCSPTVCCSFYTDYTYKKGELNVSDITINQNDNMDEVQIESGFHAYRDYDMFKYTEGSLCSILNVKSLFNGNRLDWFYLNIMIDERIAKFIIPKGSEYYQNIHGEVVSNKIIFDSYVLDVYKNT